MTSKCVLVLDLDGTIVPLAVDFDALRVEIRRLLGVDHPLRPLGESLCSLNVDEELKKQAWALIERAELESIERIDPDSLRENVEAIKRVSGLGVQVVLVTMRSTNTLRPLLEKLGLINMFSEIITRDISPSRLRQLEIVKLHHLGDKLLFIGDTAYDEEAARRLGVEFYRVYSFKDLPQAIAQALRSCVDL